MRQHRIFIWLMCESAVGKTIQSWKSRIVQSHMCTGIGEIITCIYQFVMLIFVWQFIFRLRHVLCPRRSPSDDSALRSSSSSLSFISFALYFFLSSVRLSSQLPAPLPLRLLAVLASIFRHSLCNPRRV